MTVSSAIRGAVCSGHVPASREQNRLALQCPNCTIAIGGIQYGGSMVLDPGFRCANCSFLIANDRGIWRALTAERQRYYDRFLMEYQIIRAAEGRGSDDAGFYLALPYKDLTGRNDWQWAIRARTFRHLERVVLPAIAVTFGSSEYVLDLGAGNCWLSYRLALRGCCPVAVDLLTNDQDGLGAASHYLHELPVLFPRFQAELDHLPFTDGQFDCAIFNASFHYSENYACTLGEAIRCLRPGGTVVIADSPCYQSEESGRRMLDERRQAFTKQFGFSSDGLASLEYLTEPRLSELESEFGISWQVFEPSYGLRWSMRPLIAKWKGSREPSRFRIYAAVVKTK
jgi:SAM-dependent methyltransferase